MERVIIIGLLVVWLISIARVVYLERRVKRLSKAIEVKETRFNLLDHHDWPSVFEACITIPADRFRHLIVPGWASTIKQPGECVLVRTVFNTQLITGSVFMSQDDWEIFYIFDLETKELDLYFGDGLIHKSELFWATVIILPFFEKISRQNVTSVSRIDDFVYHTAKQAMTPTTPVEISLPAVMSH